MDSRVPAQGMMCEPGRVHWRPGLHGSSETNCVLGCCPSLHHVPVTPASILPQHFKNADPAFSGGRWWKAAMGLSIGQN